jgi:hypothetical protein
VKIAANNTIPNYLVVGDFFVLWFQELFLSYAANYLLSNLFLMLAGASFSRSTTTRKVVSTGIGFPLRSGLNVMC